MEARNKKIEDWFAMIKQGQMVLPRFQRHEAWKQSQIIGLFENILRHPPLPIGAVLTLEVGDEELFHSRPIVGAPDTGIKPSLHLLDGQQRMTALWRALNRDYDDLDVFIRIAAPDADANDEEEHDADEDVDAPSVEAEKRWTHKGVRRPVWADDDVQLLDRGLIPLPILCPGSTGENALGKWRKTLEAEKRLDLDLFERVTKLRQRIASYDIPFLSLDAKTGRDTALDVFIRMNTSATPLKDFDIVVAQLEGATGDSLHDMVEELIEMVPAAREYGRVEDSILAVAALLMERPPLKKTYLDPAYGNAFKNVWDRLKLGFKQGIEFLRAEGIYNERCLPADAVVYLACSLWADVPKDNMDEGGNARSLIRKAIWRAAFTDRYGKTSATRTYADYRILRKLVAGDSDLHCELFDEAAYPLPEAGVLRTAGWPGRKDRLPRAILSTSLRRGGLDFADGAQITPDNFYDREFHHLYPVGVLGGDRKDERVNRALNCALITWATNRRVGAKTPSQYIDERAKKASLGEEVVKQRLESHLIPYDVLIDDDYDNFLSARAEVVHADMLKLCDGKSPS
ncbi:DUF262 domain-containing protein [Alteriqipengyuania sp. NZ-12B]|uniref:DUF262 domain-containing protein n=1 Tax=Alteriqipengyuania abyssalis TaxID=2860200 RepID=A0ABS7PH63_9SPHN|nr:DUF262 domain-containing protein [Alteriqipengyuania abyssalis]